MNESSGDDGDEDWPVFPLSMITGGNREDVDDDNEKRCVGQI